MNQLSLCIDRIDDDSLEELILAFEEKPMLTPKTLALDLNDFGQNGINCISRLLQEPRCTMEALYLSLDHLNDNDDALICFANALKENKTLKWLHLNGTAITITGWDAFSKLVFNTESIQATYSSNHFLQVLSRNFPNRKQNRDNSKLLPHNLRMFLKWNAKANKKMMACLKVMMHLMYCFSFEKFNGMEPEMLIRVIEFIDEKCRKFFFRDEHAGHKYFFDKKEVHEDINNMREDEEGAVLAEGCDDVLLRVHPDHEQKCQLARQSTLFHLLRSNPSICQIVTHGKNGDGKCCKRKHD